MSAPFSKPTSRDQARVNALHYAQGAQGQVWLENQRMAEMWATVALTFEDVAILEDEEQDVLNYSDTTIATLIKKVSQLEDQMSMVRQRLDSQRRAITVQAAERDPYINRAEQFAKVYEDASETVLDLAEARVRAYMTGHFTDATIIGVIGALQDVPKPRG